MTFDKPNPLRITAVSYLNSMPFVYGIQHAGLMENYELKLEVPAACGQRMINGEAEIGLIPVGVIPQIPHAKIITDYCIGATGPVRSVLLLSYVPMEKIETVKLDPESATSVRLVKVLARHFWKREWIWKDGKDSAPLDPLREAIVMIGDKSIVAGVGYPFVYDLAEEWIRFTGFPFVFAAWITNRELDMEIISRLDRSLQFGVENRFRALEAFRYTPVAGFDVVEYLNKNISFNLDEKKKRGMELFLSYL